MNLLRSYHLLGDVEHHAVRCHLHDEREDGIVGCFVAILVINVKQDVIHLVNVTPEFFLPSFQIRFEHMRIRHDNALCQNDSLHDNAPVHFDAGF